VFLFAVVLTAFWMFDKLVRLEYASYRENWEQDGQPNGFFSPDFLIIPIGRAAEYGGS
jgi:hypothetical protein